MTSPKEGARENRLAAEPSPYLRQHAWNPVDWYPWGDEAFAAARKEDKPIFLSVGYSTCHWCHVMERESFESDRIAALMNELFINIKVDREEHPDVDQIYMAAVQRTTGHGGWPMSVFLTPDLKPFYAGTYFPPDSRWGRPGFAQILERCAELWHKQRDVVVAQGEQIAELIAEGGESKKQRGTVADRVPITAAVAQISKSFDATWGGFGAAPKFPRSMTIMLLLRDRLASSKEADAKLHMAEHTLEMMWRGGLYDHVGGGFTRYSTDERWLVPHFEKMLYDNALLALTYAEAWQVSHKDEHRRVAVDVLDWVLAEMTHERGGFFSAQDADSEGEEGKFYLWSPDELEAALGAEGARLIASVYGVDDHGNFEGKSILFLPKRLTDAATALGLEVDELDRQLAPLRRALYDVREKRIHPGLDDKVLTSWNGLMIAAMARCGAVFDEPRFVEAARRAADFIDAELTEDGGLLRRWRDGSAALRGTIEDYAYDVWGRLELFEARGDLRDLACAEERARRAIELFEDAAEGGFFFADEQTPHLILRLKEPYDGATPSGNSVMAMNLARLAHVLDDDGLRGVAVRTIEAYAGELATWPMAYPFLLSALDLLLAEPEEIVVVVGKNEDEAARMIRRVRESFRPHAALIVIGRDGAALRDRLPWLADKEAVDGRSTAYVCRGRTCRLPVTSAAEMAL